MKTDYRKRLQIDADYGNDHTKFYCKKHELIAIGYCRVVIGGRGPYIEFSEHQMLGLCLRRVPTAHYYYREYRTDSGVKVYMQLHTVKYADYKIGFYYISPFDLYLADGQRVIEPLREEKK